MSELQAKTIKQLRAEIKVLNKQAKLTEYYARLYDEVRQENKGLKSILRKKGWGTE